ncbi:hypothetical protein CDL12_13902 [Handroanthus impetiginosus]|uniref:Aberrant root formation protein 4 n=1 Tax=Handroanthus impetiginosus TaxID=429701 RepID=A0A2G9H7J2_9LAMI|nr:hypothetical protein CDL12_13902 [Handroanthus impetiginosus]
MRILNSFSKENVDFTQQLVNPLIESEARSFAMLAERNTILATLDQTLASCSKLVEAGDYSGSEQSIAELVDFLNSVSDSLVSKEPGNEESEKTAIEILTQICQYVASPSLKQEVVDALAFELPKVAARFGCVSTKCLEVAEDVVDRFVERSSPRDMLSILCEAIGSPSELFMIPGYFIPLLSGITKVLVLIQRRHYAQVKTAVPVILNALKTMCSESYNEETDCEKLFHKATGIAYSIRAICVKLEGEDKKKLHALLGLYVLQIMALVSVGMTSGMSRCLTVVLELSDLLQHCELSYIGLITGYEVDMNSRLVIGDDSDDGACCFSQVKLGAALGVIWGYKASEVAAAAKADLTAVIMELQGNWTRRWEAIGTLKYIFSCANLSWELKQHGIRFLLCIMDGIVSHLYDDNVDYSMHIPTMYTSLQEAFSAFKKVLADIPTSVRFDVLRALIKNSDSSSMIGILLDCVREEMRMGKIERNISADAVLSIEVNLCTSFWNPSVLELVEEVLRPPKGGPPSLHEYSYAVLSALNLYRFILITESTGNSNCTGILSKDKLRKAYNEWFLPLRTLVTGTIAESQDNCDQLASDMLCALSPVELVLYRCIELVEEKLKHL